METKKPQFAITNEDDAWQALELLLDGRLDPHEFDISFENWPILRIRYKGRGFEGALPTRAMVPLLELQKEIYRTYQLIRYGRSKRVRLAGRPRQESNLVRIEGNYRILKVDSSADTGFKVLVRHEDRKLVFSIDIGPGQITQTQRSYLQEAEWNKSQVWMAVSAKERRGDIIGGQILDVKPTDA